MAKGSPANWSPGDDRICLICGRKIALIHGAWIHYDNVLKEHRSAHLKCGAPLKATAALIGLILTLATTAGASNITQARTAITKIFGPYSDQAMRVARCETGGTYNPNAQNGQYQGIFQMGSYARARYGHGPSWLVQAAAAYMYFVDTGRDWSPWTCKP